MSLEKKTDKKPKGNDGEQPAVADPVALTAKGLDIESFAVPQNAAEEFRDARAQALVLSVRKPHPQSFVRVHPDTDNYSRLFWLLTLKHGMNTERYLVHPSLVDMFMASKPLRGDIACHCIVLAVTRDNETMLWPLNTPRRDGGPGDAWNQSAMSAADRARSKWVRVVSNKAIGAYEVVEAAGMTDEPRWPDKPLVELVKMAFGDQIITSLDHPAVKQLRGEG